MAPNIENNFDPFATVGGEADTTVVSTDAADAKKAEKRKKNQEVLAAMQKILDEECKEDPTLPDRIGIMSQNIEVVKTLGFSGKAGLIVDKKNITEDNKRPLAPTSQVVGYRVRNIGGTPINFKKTLWSLNDEGRYVKQIVDAVIAAGETVDMSRVEMTMLGSQPEFSLVFANGSMKHSSKKSEGKGNVADELEAYFFAFNPELGLNVNDDAVKVEVGEKDGEGNWHVKQEYIATFGYLENKDKKAATGTRAKGNKINAQAAAAAAIRKMLQEGGVM